MSLATTWTVVPSAPAGVEGESVCTDTDLLDSVCVDAACMVTTGTDPEDFCGSDDSISFGDESSFSDDDDDGCCGEDSLSEISSLS